MGMCCLRLGYRLQPACEIVGQGMSCKCSWVEYSLGRAAIRSKVAKHHLRPRTRTRHEMAAVRPLASLRSAHPADAPETSVFVQLCLARPDRNKGWAPVRSRGFWASDHLEEAALLEHENLSGSLKLGLADFQAVLGTLKNFPRVPL